MLPSLAYIPSLTYYENLAVALSIAVKLLSLQLRCSHWSFFISLEHLWFAFSELSFIYRPPWGIWHHPPSFYLFKFHCSHGLHNNTSSIYFLGLNIALLSLFLNYFPLSASDAFTKFFPESSSLLTRSISLGSVVHSSGFGWHYKYADGS